MEFLLLLSMTCSALLVFVLVSTIKKLEAELDAANGR